MKLVQNIRLLLVDKLVWLGKKGNCAMARRIGNELGWADDDDDYWRSCGLWGLACEKRGGKFFVVGKKGKTEHLDGLELIPCTAQEHRDDNRRHEA